MTPADTAIIDTLLQQYYDSYHEKIQTLVKHHKQIQLALDCHSMEPVGPEIAPNSDIPLPLFCLGNVNGSSAPDDWINRLAQCFRNSFG